MLTYGKHFSFVLLSISDVTFLLKMIKQVYLK